MMHVAYLDSRLRPKISHIETSIASLARFGEDIQYHIVLRKAITAPSVAWKLYALDEVSEQMKKLHARMSKLCRGPGSQYMWKPLLPWIVPAGKLIVLDTDVFFLDPISVLWREFGAFAPSHLIGVAEDILGNSIYRGHKVKANGGVQLLDLYRMRKRNYVDLVGKFNQSIGYLGDQTFYTILGDMDLVYTLSCAWNRQLNMHHIGGVNFSDAYRCRDGCSAIHANHVGIKYASSRMQRSNNFSMSLFEATAHKWFTRYSAAFDNCLMARHASLP